MTGVLHAPSRLTVAAAQRDVRTVYANGSVGQGVSAGVWLLAGLVADLVGAGAGMATLLVGGMLILPLTTLVLRVRGGPSALPRGHPMAGLATQIAFTVPLGLLVALAAAAHREEWFFPAALVIVGAHYLPFVFLYGTRLFAALAAVFVGGGVGLVLWPVGGVSTGAWLGGVVLAVFAELLRRDGNRRRRISVPGRRHAESAPSA